MQDSIERADKPVIAALHGSALGGGLEVALCAHFRLADRETRLGLPEVKLGLLPGAGGTQRLPRLVGVAPALDMMTTGREITATQAHDLGLIDEIAHADLVETAVRFARKVVEEARPLRRIREDNSRIVLEDPEGAFREFRSKSTALLDGRRAPEAIVQCVEAVVSLPWHDAIRRERELFRELAATTESAALRYAFLAERQVRRQPASAKPSRPASLSRISFVRGGPLLEELVAALPTGILRSGTLDAECDAILLDAASDALPDTIGAPVIAIASARDPSCGDLGSDLRTGGVDFVFFVNPRLAGGRLIEIGARPNSPPDWQAIAFELARAIDATPVSVGSGPRLPSIRLVRRVERMFGRAAEDGLCPDAIHAAMTRFGFCDGPLLPVPPAHTPPATSFGRDEDILVRLVGTLVDEAARLIEDGDVSRGCEIDTIALAGLGWPRHRGGPLWQGDRWGPDRLLSVLDRTERAQGRRYQPPRTLQESVARNGRLIDLAP